MSQHDRTTICLCIKATLESGSTIILSCAVVDEDRVVPSDGTNPLDRLCVEVDGNTVWVERRDLCLDDGEPIAWRPYQEHGT